MSDRTLPDWLAAYLKYTENTEPPTSYHVWTGISTLAGALQRRVHMKWGHETIYPNMYVILVGPSGRCRKGTAMSMGKDILKEVTSISLSSESITREALIRFMKGAVTSFTQGSSGIVEYQCAVTCISPELSVFLGQQNLSFLADLTDWFDSSKEWTYETKGSGVDRIQGVCFNLLGATAPDWIQSMIPQEALGGGFTSRCIFIVESNKGKTVPRPIWTDEEEKLKYALIADLERIATISGEMKFTRGAERVYVEWYLAEERQIEKGCLPVEDPRFAGYVDRRATHIKKLCLIVSAARNDDLVITEEDFDRAKGLMKAAERNMGRVFGGLGQAKYSEVTEKVIDYIMTRREVKRSELMRIFYRDMDGQTLKIVEDVLEQMKIVRIVRDPKNGESTYIFVG